MIIQLANIGAGFVLGAPQLKKIAGIREHVHKVHGKLELYRREMGMGEFALGVIALLHRAMVIDVPIWNFGSSYPQAIAAIAMGLLLAEHTFKKYPVSRDIVKILSPHAEWIGIAGIAVGFFSIL
jgi:hypothetical protein